MKFCVVCFSQLPEKSAHNRKYCTSCKKTYIRQKEKERYKVLNSLKPKIFCVECFIEMPPETHSNTKYCRDCRIKTRREMQNGYGRKQYAKGTRRHPPNGYVRPGRKSLEEGFCDICRSFGELCRDHDNSCCTGIRYGKRCGECERGHLCKLCNPLLGMAKDSTQTLRDAINYLEKYIK